MFTSGPFFGEPLWVLIGFVVVAIIAFVLHKMGVGRK